MKYIKQFEFENWSNTQILDTLKKIEQPNERVLQLFSHLLSSHCMWLSRVNKTEFTCTLFQERTLEECEQLMQENLDGWKKYLQNKTEKDLEQSIEFMPAWEVNPSKRKMTIEDAIIHLINHSSYHRGQIVMVIKGQIEALPLSTYIMYASKVMIDMKEILQQLSVNAIALNLENFSEQEKQTQWIGKSAATEIEISEAEKRLGIKLPNDVKEFYKITNGTSEILSHTFSGFDAIENIDWLRNAIPDIIINYAEMGETYVADLTNSIIIAGVNHVHNILIIQPYGEHKDWRYWEFASYIPGETEFKGIEKYLERINDFLHNQIINKQHIVNKYDTD